ncbi:YhcN/YlaJ family sporulation lipoprotein [Schnuerera sp.]|uniref:YhcN/YlaJ family sporulation lipoprotein n=1 Tax=Schnuerera sp. TaxID=2794844 RepID=UPI002BF8EBCD|nr:YhcN/YlaJ family sporulation lipoprotein [Schnuerera sp.]HSH37121.1 YhcN/YlaJ family sporulation lipoprotein [Schnuerera sp.]
MNKESLFKIKLLLIILILSSVIVGCTKKENIVEDKKDEYNEEITLDVGGKDQDLLIRSENISDLVVNLYGIDNATSIIFNDVVAVGLEMADGTKLTDDIKEMVIKTILENDTMIRQVLITDNKKTFDQIENIILSLMNGKPYDDQVKEINRIIEKLKKE